MSRRPGWDYHEARKNVLGRLQKEWDPPAVPCATPVRSFAKKRSGTWTSKLEGNASEKGKINSFQQLRLCYRYNLQTNELHGFVSTNKPQDCLKLKESEKKPSQLQQVPGAMQKSWKKRDFIKTPKVHSVVLQYSGPEQSHKETTFFIKKAFPHTKNLTHSAKGNRIHGVQKTFRAYIPQCRLRVGTLPAEKRPPELCKQKKKEIFHV